MSEQPVEKQQAPRLADELKPKRGRKPLYSKEEAAERSKKASKAQALATAVLRQRHEDEYQTLYSEAKREAGL